MKYILTVAGILASSILYSQKPELYGEWKLTQVETETGILTPVKKDYFLTIATDSIWYNLEYNTCFGSIVLNENSISYDRVWCTEMCCDGRNEPISHFINYNGLYEMTENQLIINIDNAKLFMERLDE